MGVVWRFLRRYWWTLLAGVGAVAGFVLCILFPRRRRDTFPPGNPPRPTFKERANTEVERVRLEGEVEKARASASAEVYREEIDAIEETGKTDPVKGRRQMALWIRNNL